MKKRKGFNPKRCLASSATLSSLDVEALSSNAHYGGNPEHKKSPADYGLTPPVSPRPHKTLCDGKRPLDKREATDLLREGIRRGLISEQIRNNWPQNVWSVSQDNEVFEAQLENQQTGTYHGYPIPKDDDFGVVIIKAWES